MTLRLSLFNMGLLEVSMTLEHAFIQLRIHSGSYEAYIRAVLVRACAPVEEGGLGYRAVVVNFRGCMLHRFQTSINSD